MTRSRINALRLNHKVDIDDFTDSVHHNGILINPKISTNIFLMGENDYAGPGEVSTEPGVEYLMANRFVKNMNLARLVNPNAPVVVHSKTCGGFSDEGMSIYDSIKASQTPVTVLSYIHSRSMSSLVLLAANKRVMMPHSYFMFHDGDWSMAGTVKQVLSAMEFERRTDCMIDIYVEALKEQGKYKDMDEKRIKSMLRRKMDKKEEVYLTANEAVEWGFADEIFDGNWNNLTKYTAAQRKRK